MQANTITNPIEAEVQNISGLLELMNLTLSTLEKQSADTRRNADGYRNGASAILKKHPAIGGDPIHVVGIVEFHRTLISQLNFPETQLARTGILEVDAQRAKVIVLRDAVEAKLRPAEAQLIEPEAQLLPSDYAVTAIRMAHWGRVSVASPTDSDIKRSAKKKLSRISNNYVELLKLYRSVASGVAARDITEEDVKMAIRLEPRMGLSEDDTPTKILDKYRVLKAPNAQSANGLIRDRRRFSAAAEGKYLNDALRRHRERIVRLYYIDHPHSDSLPADAETVLDIKASIIAIHAIEPLFRARMATLDAMRL